MDHRYLLALSGILFVFWLARLGLRRRRRRKGRSVSGGVASYGDATMPVADALPSESDLRAEMKGLLSSSDASPTATARREAIASNPVERGRVAGDSAAFARLQHDLQLERSRVEALSRRGELAEAKAADHERTIKLLRRRVGELEKALEARDAELVQLRAEVSRSPAFRKRVVALETALSRLEISAGTDGEDIKLRHLRDELASLRREKTVSLQRVVELERRIAEVSDDESTARAADEQVSS